MDAHLFAYVGSRTTRERNARGQGISVYRVDAVTGALDRVQLLGDLVNPSYLALNADGTRLYTVHGDGREASAFAVDRHSGQLALLNRVDTEGLNPVHLAIAPGGRHLVVTNHLGASVVVLPMAADGALQPPVQVLNFDGLAPTGPHRKEQTQAKPHFNPFDPSGRVLLVPDKGLDRVFSFVWDGDRLQPADPPCAVAREGAGPRSAAFHPRLPLAYVVNELDSTVTTYRIDAGTGGLQPLHWLSTLPASFCGNGRAAGIQVDATGQHLYTSNRGHDSIAVFSLDAATGLPAFTEAVPTGGRTPRFFTLSPDGRMLFALNEDSDGIVPFAVDADTGRLDRRGDAVHCGSPVCMVFSA